MKRAFLGLTLLVAAASAQAQSYSTGFEAPAYAGSLGGTALTAGFGGGGQNGWYNPVAGSADFNVYTYGANALGYVNNPNGGDQFIAALGTTATPIGRAQHNVNFSSGGTWTASWDVNGQYRGAATPVNNLGSFSLQPSATADYWQQLMAYDAVPVPTQYNITYGAFAAGGGAIILTNSPGPAWNAIPTNHWIHQSTTWSFVSNQILSVSIQDITAGNPVTTVDVSGLGWYLAGGANNALGLALPTDIRCFAGNVDNTSAWDNLNVVPAPASLALLGLGGLMADRRRR